MNRGICLCLVLSNLLLADEALDREAIKSTLVGQNERLTAASPEPMSELFSPDADPAERMALYNLHHMLQEMSRRPWSEITPPALVCVAIRFLAPNIALVDGAETQPGVASRLMPLLFVMKRYGESWKIESVRPLGKWNLPNAMLK